MTLRRFSQWWSQHHDLIRNCTIFMTGLSCINSILTLLFQIPEPPWVSSPQYQHISNEFRITFAVILILTLLAAILIRPLGGFYMVVTLCALRIYDNLNGPNNWINVGMWGTVLALGVLAFATAYNRKLYRRFNSVQT